MSHYYIAHPEKLQLALDAYCAALPPDQAGLVKRTVRDFLDSPAAIERGLRIEVRDPVQPHARIT